MLNQSEPTRTDFGVRQRLILLVALLIVGIVACLLSYPTALSGDENSYFGRSTFLAKTLIQAVQTGSIDIEQVTDRIVATGYFMPGMAYLLTPIQLLFGGEAPVPIVRISMVFFNLLLVYLIALELPRFGLSPKTVFLTILVPCVVPYYLFFLGMVWGDLFGAHLAILALIVFERKTLQSSQEFGPSTLNCIKVGSLIGVCILIRPQYTALLFIVVTRITFQKLRSTQDPVWYGGTWVTAAKTSVVIVISALVLIAPWSLVASQKFGPTFLTTTIYLDPLFTNKNYMARAKSNQATSRKIPALVNQLTEDAEDSGRSFREQADFEMSLLPKKSLWQKFAKTRRHIDYMYFSEKNAFLQRFQVLQQKRSLLNEFSWSATRNLNSFSWLLLLAIGLILFMVPAFPYTSNYLLPLSLKGVVFLISIQPWVTQAHGRYYVSLIPVFAVMLAFFLSTQWRSPWPEIRSLTLHNGLIIAGQVMAMVYAVATIYLYILFS